MKSLAKLLTVTATMAGLFVIVLVFSVLHTNSSDTMNTTKVETSKGLYEPCEHEDGSTQAACYWDAEKRSNGKGVSFWAYNYGSVIDYEVK